jgi:hypothetical protein
MKINSKAGWTLILGAFLLLAVAGKLDLLVVLIPTAAVLAYGITRFPHDKISVTSSLK